MRTPWLLGLCALLGCSQPGDAPARPAVDTAADREAGTAAGEAATPKDGDPMPQTDTEWREKLTPLQYRVLRQEGTEQAYTGEYLKHDADGVYRCAGCGNALYESGTKFDQGGWPSFADAIEGSVGTKDVGGGALEVHCAKCKGHLGHIFNDGPGPTRKRH